MSMARSMITPRNSSHPAASALTVPVRLSYQMFAIALMISSFVPVLPTTRKSST